MIEMISARNLQRAIVGPLNGSLPLNPPDSQHDFSSLVYEFEYCQLGAAAKEIRVAFPFPEAQAQRIPLGFFLWDHLKNLLPREQGPIAFPGQDAFNLFQPWWLITKPRKVSMVEFPQIFPERPC